MKATLTFKFREHAEKFAIDWGRFSKQGHIVGAGQENVDVTVFNVGDLEKNWIESYISKLSN